jgi:hypothetical protein
MTMTCPACGREGKLRDGVDPPPRTVRSRHCGNRFEARLQEREPPRLEERVSATKIAATLRIDADSEGAEQAVDIPDEKVRSLGIDVSDESPHDDLPLAALPRAPWFYDFLDGWGAFYKVVSIVANGVAAFVFIDALLNQTAAAQGPMMVSRFIVSAR